MFIRKGLRTGFFLMLCALLLLIVTPNVRATAPSGYEFSNNTTIAGRIDMAFEMFEPGNSYFSKNGGPCTCHRTGVSCLNNGAGCNCLRYVVINGVERDLMAVQCMGYARFWQMALFDSTEKTGPFQYLDGTSSVTEANMRAWFEANENVLHPGTHMRFNGHSVVLLNYDYNMDVVTYIHGNWSSQSNDGCYVTDVTVSSLESFVSRFSRYGYLDYAYVYRDYSTVYPSDKPILSIQHHANGGTIDSAVFAYKYQVTESSGLNMRSGAGTDYQKVTALTKGTTFQVKIGETKAASGYTWGKTTVNGYTGWVVISDFVKKIGDAYSWDYYVADSLVYKASKNAPELFVMEYGKTAPGGLMNAASFRLYREGYRFAGWSLDADGSTGVYDQDDVTIKPEDIEPTLADGNKTVTLYAIWTESALKEMEIVALPEKQEYEVGDTLDPTGLTLKLTYGDGVVETVEYGYKLSGYSANTPGKQTVTVTCQDKTASFTVRVHNFAEATCTKPATCTVEGCGATKGTPLGHRFTNYQSDNNATVEEDGTETAMCDRGCGATDTRTDAGSKLQQGWVQVDEIWYYYNKGVKATGWLQYGPVWYYFNAKGEMMTGWLLYSGKWYYLNDIGRMVVSNWVQDAGKWYYMDENGYMVTGTYTINGVKHVFNASGVWQGESGRTGWAQENGKWYYYQSGEKKTGWLLYGKDWYYLKPSGEMQTGWLLYGKVWYYMDANGVMITGSRTIGGKVYNFDDSGICLNP